MLFRSHCRVLLPWNEKLPPWHEGLCQEPKKEVTQAYRKLLRLRHEEKTLVYGGFRVLSRKKNRFVYERKLGERTFLVDCNLGAVPCRAYPLREDWKLVYDTEETEEGTSVGHGGTGRRGDRKLLEVYGARIWRKET